MNKHELHNELEKFQMRLFPPDAGGRRDMAAALAEIVEEVWSSDMDEFAQTNMVEAAVAQMYKQFGRRGVAVLIMRLRLE